MHSEERHRVASEIAKVGVWEWDLETTKGHVDSALKALLGLRELADRIRLLLPRVRVAYVSGYTREAMGHHGVLDAGEAFIEKPFSSGILLRKVRAVLDGKD